MKFWLFIGIIIVLAASMLSSSRAAPLPQSNGDWVRFSCFMTGGPDAYGVLVTSGDQAGTTSVRLPEPPANCKTTIEVYLCTGNTFWCKLLSIGEYRYFHLSFSPADPRDSRDPEKSYKCDAWEFISSQSS